MQESVEYVKWYLNSEHNTSFEDMIAEREEKAAKKATEKAAIEAKKAAKKAAIEAEQSSLIKTAKNMLKDGLSIKHISKYTGLSKREIDKLKKGQ